MRRTCLAAVCCILATALAGCGASAADRTPNKAATLLLDARPNAVHSGIYMAVARGYDRALGVTLHVRAPSASTDAVKLLAAGRVPFAVLDIHDLAIARERGRPLVGVMALVQTPLAAILAQPSIRTPRQLQGHLVGVSGAASDRAVLRSILAGAHADPGSVRETTIGSGAVRALLSGRVGGATALWNTEGVALRAKHRHTREFRVDDYGAPAYPELVLTVTRQTLEDEPALVRATVAAISRGYSEVLVDPESGVSALLDATRGLERANVERELDAVSPSFTAGARAFGQLVPARLRAWAAWARRFGIVKRLPNVERAFDGRYVPSDNRD